MNENKLQKRFKPNVVYELLIHGVYPYIGCHTRNVSYLHRCEIIRSSGNYLAEARRHGLITWQEYLDCVELTNVWEFDTKEEAQEFEAKKIQECKEKYGDLCKNKALFGNKHGSRGCFHPGRQKGFSVSEEQKRRISNTLRGNHFFTNGTTNVYAKSCPEGFHPGLTRKRKKITN